MKQITQLFLKSEGPTLSNTENELESVAYIEKVCIESQFNYCPFLIWMFHSRTLHNKINRLHERALRIVYSDYESCSVSL